MVRTPVIVPPAFGRAALAVVCALAALVIPVLPLSYADLTADDVPATVVDVDDTEVETALCGIVTSGEFVRDKVVPLILKS